MTWFTGMDITELIDECNLAMMYRADFDKPDFKSMKQSGEKSVLKNCSEILYLLLLSI